jgi:CheY-like chemotaxis protein
MASNLQFVQYAARESDALFAATLSQNAAWTLRGEASSAYLLAVTGYSGEPEKTRALAAAFDHYLCKPIGADAPEELFAAVPA